MDKTVHWSAITAKDNDGAVPALVVTPVEILPTATSHKFSEGTHHVTFTAKDQSGNSRACSFKVKVTGSRCRLFTYAERLFKLESATFP